MQGGKIGARAGGPNVQFGGRGPERLPAHTAAFEAAAGWGAGSDAARDGRPSALSTVKGPPKKNVPPPVLGRRADPGRSVEAFLRCVRERQTQTETRPRDGQPHTAAPQRRNFR
jgi:hypothetical protein